MTAAFRMHNRKYLQRFDSKYLKLRLLKLLPDPECDFKVRYTANTVGCGSPASEEVSSYLGSMPCLTGALVDPVWKCGTSDPTLIISSTPRAG